MKYDHDILYQFIPTDHKQRFLTWNNAYQSIEGINIVGVYTVHYGVNSRAPFEERILIPLSLYMERLKQKQRDTILNQIINL